jgi:cobalt-zinc-cadmium efflux system outer membrane protein
MNKIRILFITLTILFTNISFPQSGQMNNRGRNETLQDLINTAIDVSPKLSMLRAKRNVAENKIPQNSNLPNPMLMLGLMNLPTNTFSFNQEPMTQKVVGLQQSIPFPGKLSSMEDAAAIDTLIIDKEIKDAENEIRKNVKNKYYSLSFFRKSIQLAKESKKLLEKISDVVSTKYSVSTANQQNLIKVQLEITNISDRIEDLKSKESSTLSELNALLLKEADSPIQTETFDSIKTLDITVKQLDSLSRTNRPFLQGIQLSQEKGKLKQKVAEKDYLPNFTLGVQYGQRDMLHKTGMAQSDFLSFSLGISLPINYGGKISSKVDEAISMQELYSQQYYQALQYLNGVFGTDVADLNSLKERISLFEGGLLPQAQQNLSSTMASYQVNKVDFINVIDAQNQLFKIETNLYKLKTDYLKKIAELEFLTGTGLSDNR